jgi:hypothetical protein
MFSQKKRAVSDCPLLKSTIMEKIERKSLFYQVCLIPSEKSSDRSLNIKQNQTTNQTKTAIILKFLPLSFKF